VGKKNEHHLIIHIQEGSETAGEGGKKKGGRKCFSLTKGEEESIF